MSNSRKLEELAELIVEVHRHLDPLEEHSKALKDELRHYEGQSHQTKDGSTVKISTATENRPGGAQIVFNEQAFLALSPETRAQLEKLGVIITQPKIIKGQAPKVSVALA